MLARAVVTQGYLWAAALVMMLYAVLKGWATMPVALDRKAKVRPVQFQPERALAFALGLGLFIVAMTFVWPALFPASRGFAESMAAIMP